MMSLQNSVTPRKPVTPFQKNFPLDILRNIIEHTMHFWSLYALLTVSKNVHHWSAPKLYHQIQFYTVEELRKFFCCIIIQLSHRGHTSLKLENHVKEIILHRSTDSRMLLWFQNILPLFERVVALTWVCEGWDYYVWQNHMGKDMADGSPASLKTIRIVVCSKLPVSQASETNNICRSVILGETGGDA